MAAIFTINFPPKFYWEMWMSEVDTVDEHSDAAHVGFAKALREGVKRSNGYRVTLTEGDAVYYVTNIEYHTDRWNDLGQQELSFHTHILTGRRISNALRVWLAGAGLVFRRDGIGVDRLV